ncbi:dihydropyrimidinase [Bosea sp. Leaf344]|uniref:dihydropyrimidinase n=1 Tax=Bosea sp. Leaf344 TaxID=1736346 RepID=UPI0006F27BE4|nr:dihydropyrimidinase [Bosea sp. Leaf344]KQU54679.1 dihydropyrimidinase [Bosea sp. Leaf344]
MTSPAFDTVIRGGTLATASEVVRADLGIRDGRIAAIGIGLPEGAQELDATGRLVLPGGVDTHCHIEQLSGGGLMNADTFETATRSAAFGGTTSVISFAAQHRGASLARTVEDYAALARKGAIIDYAFHLMVANPDAQTIATDLPALIQAGHRSVKVFMTYDAVQVDDQALLDVMLSAREAGALVCVHAENHGLLKWMGERLAKRGYTAPKYHAVSHPRAAEVEAFHRLIAFSELLDTPICIFHVSTAEGAAVIREARGRGVKIYAETCPHYLLMTAAELDRPGIEGAKWICSPPQRETADQEALWRALALGDLQILSSDHAPYRFDASGKLSAGANPPFKQIANGMPGLEMRMPMLFDAMVSRGRLGLSKFVELTATAPARIYDLPGKGALAIGFDADIVLWDPQKTVTLTDALHCNTGYNPFAGRSITGWPETVLRRGEIIVADGALRAEAGSGRLLLREAGEATRPTGRLAPEFDPARNFGAELY